MQFAHVMASHRCECVKYLELFSVELKVSESLNYVFKSVNSSDFSEIVFKGNHIALTLLHKTKTLNRSHFHFSNALLIKTS